MKKKLGGGESATLGFPAEERNLGLRLAILTNCITSGSNNRGI